MPVDSESRSGWVGAEEHQTGGPWPVWLLALLVFLVTILTGNLTGLGIGRLPLLYDTIALPRLVVTLVLVALAWTAWSVRAVMTGAPIRLTAEWGILTALFAWAVVSAVWSPHRALGVLGQSERLEGLVTFGVYALLYGIGLQAVRGIGDLRRIAAGLGAGGIVASVHGLAQFFGWDPASYLVEGYAFDLRRAFAGFGNPDFLAALLVLTLPVVGGLALTARERTARVGWSIGSAIVAAALFATFSRSAWLVAILMAAALAVLAWRRRSAMAPEVKRLLASLVAALTIVVAVSLLAGSAETDVGRRMRDLLDPGGSAGERVRLLKVAAAATFERPLTGYGPDAFVAAFRANRTEGFAPTATLNNAHSWPLQISATLGLPGALLLVSAIGLALRRAARLLSRREDRRPEPLLVAVFAGCAGLTLFMVLNVAVLGATVPFWVLLGALAAPSAMRRDVSPLVLRTGAAAAVVTAVTVSIGGGLLLAADGAYLSSRVAFREDHIADALSHGERAVSLNPLSLKYRRGLAETHLQKLRSEIAGSASSDRVRLGFEAADRALERTLDLDPADYAALAWRAGVQARAAAYLRNESLARAAASTARRASRLDRQHVSVARLAVGERSDEAVKDALSVLPLP